MTQQWSTLTRILVATISIIIITTLAIAIRPLWDPIIISFLLAYILQPVIRSVDQYTPLSYRWSVAIIYLLMISGLAALASFLIPLVIRIISDLPAYINTAQGELEAFLAEPYYILNRRIELDAINEIATQFFNESIPDSVTDAVNNILQLLQTTSLSLAWILLILVSTFYLLLDWNRLSNWTLQLAPPDEQEDMRILLTKINLIWSAYLRGIFRLMLITTVICSIILFVLGMPGSFPLAVLTGLLVAIPEIGPIVSGLVATLLAFAQGSSILPLSNFWFAVVIAITYFVLFQVYILWLQPRIMASYLKMNTGVVFVAIAGAIVSQGILTVFLVVPLLASARVIGHYLRAKLLSLDPWAADWEKELQKKNSGVDIPPQSSTKPIISNNQ
ncbi:MAG TPA: AI-2E family transporter [Anaerolineae bacterium]|nr:AI-2E family transporter [Anaerolineae bacterium]